jgi:hypothetical protein
LLLFPEPPLGASLRAIIASSLDTMQRNGGIADENEVENLATWGVTATL